MDDLFDCLAMLSDRPLGTVVHVGAGNGPVLEHYARLAPARAVLVEGDPDAAAQLQRRATTSTWAEEQAHPVAAQSGPLSWHRYNLPMLNGPLDAAALGTYYPRLRLAESRTLEALALTALLEALNLRDDAERIHVLVLDVPGQEDVLLAALPQGQLNAFGAVLLRGCREALHPGGAAAGQGVAQLRRRCYQAAVPHAEQESLWPVTLLRFDSARYQTEQLQQRIDTLEAVLGQREQAVAELQAACVRLTDTADAQQRLLEARQTQLQVLTQAHANLENTAQEGRAQIDSLGQAKAAAEATAAERAARIELLVKERDEQAHRHQKNAKRLKSLQTEVEALRAKSAEAQTQRQALAQAKAELEQAAQTRQAQVEALTRANAAAQATLAERLVQIEHLTKAQDEQARRHQENAKSAQGLKAENDGLAAERGRLKAQIEGALGKASELEATNKRLLREGQDRDARQRLLDSEIVKAEAQLELIKDVLLREKNF
jgi:hypothetical protein